MVEGQLPFAAAVAHKESCMKLGFQKSAGENAVYRTNFAVVYDAVARYVFDSTLCAGL